MKKRNLNKAIAKFEELAANDEYEGNRKIINLDKFLQSDLSKKKKKRDHLESTPIKSNVDGLMNDSYLNNTFEDDSSNEVKTADEFLKRLISQPSKQLVNRQSQQSKKRKSKSNSLLNFKQPKQTINKQSSLPIEISKSPDKKSLTKSVLNKSKSKSITSVKKKTLKESKIEEAERQGDRKLKEYEKKFLMKFQQNRRFDEESEEYDDEDFERLEEQSLDDESIDPENSSLINEQELENESIDESIAKSIGYNQDQSNEFISEFRHNQYNQRHNPNILNKMCVRQLRSTNNSRHSQRKAIIDESIDYITNYEYQRTATEELYNLILKSDDCSYNILTKLIKNIKETIDQVHLPHPSKVRPFFHFTPDNQIHTTFLFINPDDIYSNPWQQIISVNYSNLSILFRKIYELIFNFNILIEKL